MRKIYILLLLLIVPFVKTNAQTKFPQGLFSNPLNIPINLAGSFAECRPNHFHTGIDLKTNNVENLPVLAAADGYISRISISHSGYGNCLYLTHPNGYTTVYGHLNDFVPSLMNYLKEQQYAQKKWNVDIKLPADSFVFKQGEQIAFSGNTGGSTAPHLHFEIRDTKTELVYNPLFFGFEVQDNIAPKASQLAYYNAEQFYDSKPIYFNLASDGNNNYHASLSKIPFDKVYIGTDVLDYVNGSSNWLGIKSMQLYVDNKLVAGILIEGLSFKQNRAINAYADFGTFKRKGQWFQGLYRLKNNPLDVYQQMQNNGTIDLSDGQMHQIKISIKDAFDNESIITHSLQYEPKNKAISICKREWIAGRTNYYVHFTSNLFLKIPSTSLYDNICAAVKETLKPKALSSTFNILNPDIPSHDYFELGIRLYKPLPNHLSNKVVFVHKIANANLPGSNSQDAQAAELRGSFAYAKARSFGQYSLAIDTIAPSIKMHQNQNTISFTVNENYTFIKQFDVYINGEWACFKRKGNVFSYTLSKSDPKGQLSLKAIAMDDNENKRELSFTVKH